MTTHTHRVELSTRAPDLSAGLQAQIADPAWMLARQQQLGELRGEDASTPLRLQGRMELAPVVRLVTGEGSIDVRASGPPWEALVEGEARGTGDPTAEALEAGLNLMRLLQEGGAGALWPVLRKRADLRLQVGANASAETRLLARRGIDGHALRNVLRGTTLAAIATQAGLGPQLQKAATLVETAWRSLVDGAVVRAPGEAWSTETLAYRFGALASVSETEVLRLEGRRYDGDRLDAHSLDAGKVEATPKGLSAAARPTASSRVKTFDVLPTPVRYAGQPNDRWWAFEDGGVDFGGIEMGVEDPARQVMADFACAYGDDWFLAPLRLPFGALARVAELEVLDAFGLRAKLSALAVVDGPKRTFRLFELSGDAGPDDRRAPRAPWMLLPHVATEPQRGEPVEAVLLMKDELSNLGWGVERQIQGADGAGHAHAEPRAKPAPPVGDGVWRLTVLPTAPPRGWIPLVRVRGDGVGLPDGVEVLQRARLSGWDEARGDGPRSALLRTAGALLIRDHELVSPLLITRGYQRCRSPDGGVVLWCGRSRRVVRGQPGPAMVFDQLKRS